MSPSPTCEQCRALYERYRETLDAYLHAVRALNVDADQWTTFDRHYEKVEFARLAFERQREAYKSHLSVSAHDHAHAAQG
jgi:hypothetical protein